MSADSQLISSVLARFLFVLLVLFIAFTSAYLAYLGIVKFHEEKVFPGSGTTVSLVVLLWLAYFFGNIGLKLTLFKNPGYLI
ncbi:MAG: hypothetical protein AAF197_00575, partial [Pseudomonadota bacterium]